MITKTEVKSYLGITANTYDTVLEFLVSGCVAFVESQIRRKIDSASYTELHNGGKEKYFVRNTPMTAITSVKYNAGTQHTPNWQTVPLDNVTFEASGVVEAFGLPCGIRNIEIIYTGGYASTPADLGFVIVQLVAKAFEQRNAQGKAKEAMGGVSVDWKDTLSAEQEATIKRYRRLV